MDRALVEARHLLLHATGELQTGRLYQILPGGPQLFSGRDLLKKHYPAISPDRMAERFYLVYSIAQVKEPEFQGRTWDVCRLPARGKGRQSALPLGALMKADV